MPDQWKTKARSVRVPDELWEAAKEKAERENTTLTAVILDALRRFVGDNRVDRGG